MSLIDLLGGDDDAATFLEVIERDNRPQKISSVTVLELYEGVGRAETPRDKRERILRVLDSKSVVAADETIMRKAGTLSGELIGEGARIDREDSIIAATALLTDEPVVTRNTAHFDRIDGLEVRSC